MTKPHVLYLAAAFPPAPTAGVYRALGTAQGLVAAGFELTTLTLSSSFWAKYFGTDWELASKVPDSVQVVSTDFEWITRDGDLRNWPEERLLDPHLWEKNYIAREESVFPERHYGLLANDWVEPATKIHNSKPIDLTIATGNPFASFATARKLKQSLDIPYIVDYRDGWMLNVYDGKKRFPVNSSSGQLESEILADSAEVWFVNKPMRDWYCDTFPQIADKCRIIYNAWDPPRAQSNIDHRLPDRKLKFGYIGSISPHVPMQVFEQGWSLASSNALANAEAHIYDGHSAYRPPDSDSAAQRTGNPIVAHSRLSKEEVRHAYSDLDALLFIVAGDSEGAKFVSSGKIYEYLSTGLPIVSIHDPSLAAVEHLIDYPLWFNPAEQTPPGIARALEEAATFLRSPDIDRINAAKSYGLQFRRDLIMAPPMAELRSWFPQNADVV